ncbi:hypothetical protein D9M68_241380 [compost metagenome]
MNRIRSLSLAVALAFLGACGDSTPPLPKTPPGAPVPKPPVVKPAAPALPPAAPDAQKPAPAKPELPRSNPPKADESPPARPKPAEQKPELVVRTAPAKVEDTQLPPARLDLSLPKELVEDLKPEESLSAAGKPLLPELFAPKPAVESPYQLSGKLITNDQGEDYWQSVEGAQLQIEIKN